MQVEYLEVRFVVRFGHGQIQRTTRKKLLGGTITDYKIPKEILLEVVAIADTGKENSKVMITPTFWQDFFGMFQASAMIG